MNIATIMGKIKNVPKIIKTEEGKEEAIISIEVERSFKNNKYTSNSINDNWKWYKYISKRQWRKGNSSKNKY